MSLCKLFSENIDATITEMTKMLPFYTIDQSVVGYGPLTLFATLLEANLNIIIFNFNLLKNNYHLDVSNFISDLKCLLFYHIQVHHVTVYTFTGK